MSGMNVRSDMPCGNAVVLDLRNEDRPPEVHFTPEPRDGPEAIWFFFAVDPGASRAPQIRCVLHFFENLLGKQAGATVAGFHPVYRTWQRDWIRIEAVERTETPDGRVVLAWPVPGDEGRVEVALSYPYGQAQLDELVLDLRGVFEAAPIGLSSGRQLLMRLANDPGQPGGERPGIYCLARQHAAEAPGSWVLDGFLRRIAEAGAAAPLVWAVPFADVDGVLAGHAGKDRFPWDFNRAWGSKRFPKERASVMGTHPMRHEIKAIQNDLLRWAGRCRPCLALDFHAPTVSAHQGIYAYLRRVDAEGRPDTAHAPWISAFHDALDPRIRAERFAQSGQYSGRWNTARFGDFVNEAMGLPEVTFETPYGASGSFLFDRDGYRAAGRSMAEAVLRRTQEPGTGP